MGFLLVVRDRFALTQEETLHTLTQRFARVKLRVHYRIRCYFLSNAGAGQLSVK